jgi:DNA-binding response OmpR family regulator
MKIMIIEDEQLIRQELKEILSNYGYDCIIIEKFDSIISQVKEKEADLILLDINLPFQDGYFLCREIRKFTDTPIIVVTSRNNEIDEIMSMNLGADDFVTKPYNINILLARIESLLRRTYNNQVGTLIEHNGLTLDIDKGTIQYNGNEEVLSKNELRILYYMMKNKDKILSREDLMEHLWSSDIFIDNNTLSVNMTRLRKKLSYIGKDDIIETRRGLGYILK